jgi:hypothetical protein
VDAEARWGQVEADWLARKGIVTKKMLRSSGLAGPNGKVFASLVDGRLVLKLPASRVDALIDDGVGERFSSGSRPMKEWVSVDAAHERRWPELVEEAQGFVAGGAADRSRSFTAVVTTDRRRRVLVPIPFDPDVAWGAKREHHVAGTVNGMRVRAVIEPLDDGQGILLGPAWRRDCGISPGDQVAVVLAPEGPQREGLAPDVAAAFEASPDAGAFFDSIAQFYRRAYLTWIEATKRRPDERAARIREVVALLEAGVKQRPLEAPSASVTPRDH